MTATLLFFYFSTKLQKKTITETKTVSFCETIILKSSKQIAKRLIKIIINFHKTNQNYKLHFILKEGLQIRSNAEIDDETYL